MNDYKNNDAMIVGLGTGRCGTQSLAYLLNIQREAQVTHECLPIIPWQGSECLLNEKLKAILKRSAKIKGDIAFYYLPYVLYIMSHYSKVKFICMQRPMEETVTSYMKKTRERNHWNFHDGVSYWRHDPVFDPAYPKYSFYSCEQANSESLVADAIQVKDAICAEAIKRHAVEQYWRDYYRLAGVYEKKYPQKFKIFQMQDLNTEEGVVAILNFCGVDDKNLVVSVRKWSAT